MENNYGEGIHFIRLRRITGYLVGDISRMNSAKQSEVTERLTHDEDNADSNNIIDFDRSIDEE